MTAEEFLDSRYSEFNHLDSGNIWVNIENLMIDFAKLHVEAQNKAILEKAEILIKDDYSSDYTLKKSETVNYKNGGVYGVYAEECTKHTIEIDKDSILNAYPLSLIK